MASRSQSSVIVTSRALAQTLTGREAMILEAAVQDGAADAERQAVRDGMLPILAALQAAEQAAGAPVLVAPNDALVARLQSLVASGEAGNLNLTPLPAGGFEATFDTHDWFGWATVAWSKLKHLVPHAMVRPRTDTAQPFSDAARIAVLGDWATGLYGAPVIAQAVRDDRDPFAMLLHLGDVYYSGTDTEVQQRFLEFWPTRGDAFTRALNSNHEMYSGGDGYFNLTLPRFGQEGSYFAVQNRHWTLVGLDTAYQDHAIDDEQVRWLRAILAASGDRKVVLFSHHQLYSHFETQGEKLWSHPGFGEILRSRRIFAWYWGHEHRCSIFDAPDARFGILGRCIGHGGMPQSRDGMRTLPRAGEPEFARAEWRRSPAQAKGGNMLPSVAVLDGCNAFIRGEEDKFAPHGYAVLALDGPTLTEQVRDPRGQVIYEKVLAS